MTKLETLKQLNQERTQGEWFVPGNTEDCDPDPIWHMTAGNLSSSIKKVSDWEFACALVNSADALLAVVEAAIKVLDNSQMPGSMYYEYPNEIHTELFFAVAALEKK